MAYNPSLGALTDVLGKGLTSTPKVEGVKYGRVVEVILSKEEPGEKYYKKYGELESINGIFYKNIFDSTQEDELDTLPFAYYDSTAVTKVPFPGEIVMVYSRPKRSTGEGDYPFVNYYTDPINIWNNPHHNILPDPKSSNTEVVLGDNLIEKENITGLHPFGGDVLLEGRLGQSLRFSGYKHPLNSFTDDSNNGKPFAILKVGQDKDFNKLEKYIENIDKDPSSIYLTSEHVVPITPSVTKQDSFKGDKPEDINIFKGNQVVVDSGRIVLHSKTDSLLLNSKNYITLGSNAVNVDALEYISSDAPEIFIGAKAEQPAVLGDSNEEFLKKLLSLLQTIANNFNLAKDPVSTTSAVAGLGPFILKEVSALTSKLESLKSKKVKVE